MVTIELPEDVLERVVRLSQAATPKDAVLQALHEFAERRSQAHLIPLLGTFDDMVSDNEFEEMREGR